MPTTTACRGLLTDLEISGAARRFVDWYRDLWLRQGGLPPRVHADPLDIPELLPWVWMYQRTDDGDFLCRFAGQRIDNRLQRESLQFMRLSEVLPADRYQFVSRRINTCLEQAGIAYGWTSDPAPEAGRQVERCFAPLTGDGARTDTIIGITLYGADVDIETETPSPPFVNRLRLYDPQTLAFRGDIS